MVTRIFGLSLFLVTISLMATEIENATSDKTILLTDFYEASVNEGEWEKNVCVEQVTLGPGQKYQLNSTDRCCKFKATMGDQALEVQAMDGIKVKFIEESGVI